MSAARDVHYEQTLKAMRLQAEHTAMLDALDRALHILQGHWPNPEVQLNIVRGILESAKREVDSE